MDVEKEMQEGKEKKKKKVKEGNLEEMKAMRRKEVCYLLELTKLRSVVNFAERSSGLRTTRSKAFVRSSPTPRGWTKRRDPNSLWLRPWCAAEAPVSLEY